LGGPDRPVRQADPDYRPDLDVRDQRRRGPQPLDRRRDHRRFRRQVLRRPGRDLDLRLQRFLLQDRPCYLWPHPDQDPLRQGDPGRGENDENEERFFAINAKQLGVLLNTTEIKSADYNTVKALVKGELDTFCGFKFIRTERLPSASSVRTCYAWSKNSMLLGIGTDIVTRVSERADKNYATQVYAGMSIGAVRMDEKGVVKVEAYEG